MDYENFRVITSERPGPLSEEDVERIRQQYAEAESSFIMRTLKKYRDLNKSRGLDKFERVELLQLEKMKKIRLPTMTKEEQTTYALMLASYSREKQPGCIIS